VEKYGVEQDNVKVSSETRELCRTCGAVLRPQEETGVLLCPRCGSRPYEGGA